MKKEYVGASLEMLKFTKEDICLTFSKDASIDIDFEKDITF